VTEVLADILTVDEVARHYRWQSNFPVHDRARKLQIPHIKRAHTKRLIFVRKHLELWDAGAPLVTIELEDGGRAVVPASEAEGVMDV
jgi:hypothetical protein